MPTLTIAAPPLSKNHALARRQRVDLRRAAEAVEHLMTVLDPAAVAALMTAADAAASADPADEGDRAAFDERFGLRSYSSGQRAALEARSQARYFAARRALLLGALTAPEVGERLGLSRQTPHNRAKMGIYLAIGEHGAWRFPAWQFDPSGPDGVVPHFPEALSALGPMTAFAKALWFTAPNPYLEGRRPIDALRTEPSRVLDAARGAAGGAAA